MSLDTKLSHYRAFWQFHCLEDSGVNVEVEEQESPT